jgi:L,D-transpeptidase catalytic domain
LKKLIVPIILSGLSLSFSFIPTIQEANNASLAGATPFTNRYFTIDRSDNAAVALYSSLNLEQYGLSLEAFSYAYKGYQRLLEKKLIACCGYLTICDFSQSSKNKRFYLVDLNNNKLLLNTYVAHGRNSGGEYATKFSNKPESLESSLGFYVTRTTYIGEHGLALRIDGVDAGYNDKARQRNIVIHGAEYIDEAWLHHSNYMGRSYGCPAVPQKESSYIINTIKNGTCLFIYHPVKSYLEGSKILNG